MDKLESLIARLEKVTSKIEGHVGEKKDVKQQQAQKGPSEFEMTVLSLCKNFKSIAVKIDIKQITQITEGAIEVLYFLNDSINLSKICKPPSPDYARTDIMPMFNSSIKNIKDIGFKQKDFEIYANAVADGLQVIAFPFLPTPLSFVEQAFSGVDFSGNKILKKKIEDHTAWVKAFKAILAGIKDYVKENYEFGFTWNNNGQDLSNYESEWGKSFSTYEGASSTSTSQEEKKTHPLFTELKQKGKEETKQKTESKATPVAKKVVQKPATQIQAKEPKRAAQGNNIYYENYKDTTLTLDKDDISLSNGFFFKNCQNVVVLFKSKVRNVFVEQCSKFKLSVQTIISVVEFINCTKSLIQCNEKVPSVSIERSSEMDVYLYPPSQKCKISTTKSSEMKVHYSIGDPTDPDNWVDANIPHMFETIIQDNKAKTTPADLMED